MLRSMLKVGIKSSIIAADKIKYGLGCLKEDIEDIAAEVKAELKSKPEVYSTEDNSDLKMETQTQQNSTVIFKKNQNDTHQENKKC